MDTGLRKMLRINIIFAFFMAVMISTGCDPQDGGGNEGDCFCTGESPTGSINLVCGESICLGGQGYSCSAHQFVEPAPEACACSPGECTDGDKCMNASCVPNPECNELPARDCTGSAAFCGELIQMNPSLTDAYDDYPINGETASNQYRSWMRRDLAMLVEYASAVVACRAASWPTGNGGPLGLGDMS